MFTDEECMFRIVKHTFAVAEHTFTDAEHSCIGHTDSLVSPCWATCIPATQGIPYYSVEEGGGCEAFSRS